MVCRLKDFAVLILKLLMFKACGIISISKFDFCKFFGTEWVKQIQKNKKIKTIQNYLII